jgi:hypothetical protein
MFWRLFALGFVMDQRTVRQLSHIHMSVAFAEPVPDKSQDLKRPPITHEDILDKRILFRRQYSNEGGQDMRYPDLVDPNELIFNITRFYYQMNLLRKLESSEVSLVEKMSAIDQHDKETQDGGYIAELKKGGLWKDWNIDL